MARRQPSEITLAGLGGLAIFPAMSLAEIKEQVSRLNADDRDELVGFLKLLAIRNDPSRSTRLAERLTRLASGTGVDEAGLMARFPHLRSSN